MAQQYVGIEIGGTKLQLVRGTATGEILAHHRAHVVASAGANGIQSSIEKWLPDLLTPEVVGIGVGFGGPVDRTTGSIACSHQIPGWSGFRMVEWLNQTFRLPAILENDANVAALGEALLGAGRGRNPVFYVTLGSGVGGGLVVDRSIYHGATPGEAEIGHLRLDPSGVVVEQRCSGWAVDRKIREAIRLGGKGMLPILVQGKEGGEARHLSEALNHKDALALRILDETATDLAFALSHVTHLFHPEIIVLGGGLSLLGEPLRNAVAKCLPRFLMEAFQPGPVVSLAELGEEMVPKGALLSAAQLVNKNS